MQAHFAFLHAPYLGCPVQVALGISASGQAAAHSPHHVAAQAAAPWVRWIVLSCAQAASGINHVGDYHEGPLVPVTAVTFEAPRVGAPRRTSLESLPALHISSVRHHHAGAHLCNVEVS